MKPRTRRGQGMVEYALIVLFMAVLIIGTATAVGAAVKGNLNSAGSRVR